MSFYSAADEVAGDSGVQGKESSRPYEVAEATGRIPVDPDSVGFKPSSSSSSYFICAQSAHLAEPSIYRLEEKMTQVRTSLCLLFKKSEGNKEFAYVR